MLDHVSAQKEQRNLLIDKEAQRRCLQYGNSLDYMACRDPRFAHDDPRPWWKAVYFDTINREIERLEKAGFNITVTDSAFKVDRTA